MQVYDEDMISDDLLGRASVDLAVVRTKRSQHTEVPVIRPKSGKQHGFISLVRAAASLPCEADLGRVTG